MLQGHGTPRLSIEQGCSDFFGDFSRCTRTFQLSSRIVATLVDDGCSQAVGGIGGIAPAREDEGAIPSDGYLPPLGAALHLAIHLRTQENDDYADPHPKQKGDWGSHGAIGCVHCRKPFDVDWPAAGFVDTKIRS